MPMYTEKGRDDSMESYKRQLRRENNDSTSNFFVLSSLRRKAPRRCGQMLIYPDKYIIGLLIAITVTLYCLLLIYLNSEVVRSSSFR